MYDELWFVARGAVRVETQENAGTKLGVDGGDGSDRFQSAVRGLCFCVVLLCRCRIVVVYYRLSKCTSEYFRGENLQGLCPNKHNATAATATKTRGVNHHDKTQLQNLMSLIYKQCHKQNSVTNKSP